MEKKSVEHEVSMVSSYCSTISDQIPIDFPSLPDIFDLPPLPSSPDVLPPPPPPPSLPPPPPMSNNNGEALELSDQAVTTMFTRNSSSFSSTLSEALNDVGEEDQNKTNKLLKPKKKNQKRQREPRTAFFTKSKTDNLDDGYRWIKYGQKAIKNSPFPRSYYRCTTPECGVKKMVERSNSDPESVITTYVGTHTHPLPDTSRRNPGLLPPAIRTNYNGGVPGSSPYMMGSEILVSSSFTHSMSPSSSSSSSSSYMIDSGLFTSSPLSHSMSSSYMMDSELLTSFPLTHSMSSSYTMRSGLLEDMLPPQMLMQEPKE